MVKRSLPTRHNPHALAAKSQDYEELIALRRAGQTTIQTNSRSKREPAEHFNYVHLKVLLPKELADGDYELFPSTSKSGPPEQYFLMRRSHDGCLSATGMFKAAFPFATKKEEQAEREYLKNDPAVSGDELAGNIWITPERALRLAKEYKVETWIHALLDNTPIPLSQADMAKNFTVPEPFHPAEPNTKQGRARYTRATASPEPINPDDGALNSLRKIATPSAKGARARKDAATKAALQKIDEGEDKVKKTAKGISDEVTELGHKAADLAAEKYETAKSAVRSRKRKAEEAMLDQSEVEVKEVGTADESAHHPRAAKRTKNMVEEELKIERVKNRALLTLSGALAIGTILPYIL